MFDGASSTKEFMSESKDFKSNFIEFLRHSGPNPKDTLDDDLKLMGFDPKKIGERGSQLAKELFEKQLVSQRHAAHLARLMFDDARPASEHDMDEWAKEEETMTFVQWLKMDITECLD